MNSFSVTLTYTISLLLISILEEAINVCVIFNIYQKFYVNLLYFFLLLLPIQFFNLLEMFIEKNKNDNLEEAIECCGLM